MKESTQTLLFLFAALASIVAAWKTQPTDATYEVDQLIGKPLFNPFETEVAKSLRIARFNEETASLSEFEVAEEDGVWSIPSKGGYPADAERQMAEATTGVIDLEILSIASQSAEDHEEYGVVEPASTLEVGATGVGTRVVLSDDAGKELVDVVIGKEVKGAADQHYVRRTSQDVVYTVAIDPSKFSTTFEDWIEDDLLDLNTWDIARVRVNDYSAELVMQGFQPSLNLETRGDYVVDFDEGENAWKVHSLKSFDRETREFSEIELGEGRSLDEETLNDLKNAVGDLRIVDVERKPTGLSADLKAGDDFLDNRNALTSLIQRGFAPLGGDSGGPEILSSEGEVVVTTREGVDYVLRFGDLQISTDTETPDEESEGESAGVNRYLFVMARLNAEMIEEPELEELPAEDAEAGEEGDTREEVEKRNQRAQDAYDQRVEAAKQRVEQLNARFGDWYYVISDEVYKQIAIGQDELIKADEPAAEGEAEAPTPGPLGSIGGGIPGLPNVPGVEFNPGAAAETAETSEADPATEEAAEEALTEETEAADEPSDSPEEEAAEAVEEAVEEATPGEA